MEQHEQLSEAPPQCYAYHPERFTFAGSYVCDPDPETPGEFLLPAHTTLAVPDFEAPHGIADSLFFSVDLNAWEWRRDEQKKIEYDRWFRDRRDILLAQCDWTMLPDAPITSAEREQWKAYRQALRDIPQQEGFPLEFSWPSEPEKGGEWLN